MENSVFMQSRDGAITENYIAGKLVSLGISEADTVMVSCRLPFIGRLAAGASFAGLSRAIIEAIIARIGTEGTLVVPAYSYSFCRDSDFAPGETPSTLGIFFETFRQQYACGRTLDPIFSVCAWGKQSDFLINGPNGDCFGANSFFSRFHALPESKFLLIGLNFHYITNFHFVEQMSGVSYRYMKDFPGAIIMPDGRRIRRIQKYFVRSLATKYEFKNFFKYVEENHLGRSTPFGNVAMKTIQESIFVQTVAKLLQEKEDFFLKACPGSDGGKPGQGPSG